MSFLADLSLFPLVCTVFLSSMFGGLLGLTDIGSEGLDLWQAVDFIAFRELIQVGARDDKSVWLTGVPLCISGKWLPGDPGWGRIQFNSPKVETVLPVRDIILLSKYIVEVHSAASRHEASDILVGHGEESTALVGSTAYLGE